MKKMLFVLFILFAANAQAQIKEGMVIYEKKMDLYKLITDPAMQSRMPQFRTAKFSLLFTDTASLFKSYPDDQSSDQFGGGGMMRMASMLEGDWYKNLNQRRSVESREIGKTYLIEDSIRKTKWKMTAETKQILGHNCRKAVVQMPMSSTVFGTTRVRFNGRTVVSDTVSTTKAPEEIEVAAWFAEDIPVSSGPDTYGGLPGLILELDFDKGGTTFTALQVKEQSVTKDLKEPTKGKKITREEFTNLTKDLMQSGMGGGGMMRMSN
jgi:GLPGLI family protein